MHAVNWEEPPDRRAPLIKAVAVSILLHCFGLLPGMSLPVLISPPTGDARRLEVKLTNPNETSKAQDLLVSERQVALAPPSLPAEKPDTLLFSPARPESRTSRVRSHQTAASVEPQIASITRGAHSTAVNEADRSPDISAYRSLGLDPAPRLLSEVDPSYPDAAGVREGRVVLRILVNERGIVDDVMVINAFPKGVFDEAAMSAFRSALFSPGRYLGVPVKSQLSIEVEFLPTNRGANVSGRGY